MKQSCAKNKTFFKWDERLKEREGKRKKVELLLKEIIKIHIKTDLHVLKYDLLLLLL